MQKVIIIRGTPASGKSTIAKSYRSFENKIAWLKVDNFKDFFADDASPALEYVNGSAIATLRYLLEQGFSVVIEGVFQDISAIDKAVEVVKESKVPVRVFELEASLESLKKRDVVREGVPEGKRPPLGDETIERIYNILKENPYPNSIKLNTETNNLEQTKEIINNSY